MNIMLINQNISDEAIINCLTSDYDIDVVTLNLLMLGADMNGSVYKAIARDKQSYFVKLKHGHQHAISTLVTEFLQNSGIKQLILPVKNKSGLTSHHLNDYTVLVYPLIEGTDGFQLSLTNKQWNSLGSALRQIHAVTLPEELQQQLRHENFSPKFREKVRSLYSHIDTHSDSDAVSQKLLTFIKTNLGTIKQLVDKADTLAEKLRQEYHPSVLCHSDLHGGNIFLDTNENFYIIDWDDPILAPKERDLMFIGGGVGNVWNKPDEENNFYSGYGNSPINKSLLAYYRLERVVEDIASFGEYLLLTTKGGDYREVSLGHFISMFAAGGAVDIALKTVIK
jgi:spectinomycin phosphotransferase